MKKKENKSTEKLNKVVVLKEVFTLDKKFQRYDEETGKPVYKVKLK